MVKRRVLDLLKFFRYCNWKVNCKRVLLDLGLNISSFSLQHFCVLIHFYTDSYFVKKCLILAVKYRAEITTTLYKCIIDWYLKGFTWWKLFISLPWNIEMSEHILCTPCSEERIRTRKAFKKIDSAFINFGSNMLWSFSTTFSNELKWFCGSIHNWLDLKYFFDPDNDKKLRNLPNSICDDTDCYMRQNYLKKTWDFYLYKHTQVSLRLINIYQPYVPVHKENTFSHHCFRFNLNTKI